FSSTTTASTELYTLSLHDALPISPREQPWNSSGTAKDCSSEPRTSAVRHASLAALGAFRDLANRQPVALRPASEVERLRARPGKDRKSTRLNSSHLGISYAVCLLK